MGGVKHTPGPWKFTTLDIGDEDFILVPWGVISENGVQVIDGEGGLHSWEGAATTPEERYANARLITAAPELLAVARSVVDMLGNDCHAYKTCEMARAAISKATAEASP
jgi:hypothetical protein